MKLKPGCEVEYEKRHRAIWPELVKLLKETGVSDYYIFWDKETNLLFAVQEQGGESGSQDLGTNPIVKKWWDYMADIMDVNASVIADLFRQTGASVMIHGHTHRPDIHALEANGDAAFRAVLGAWHTEGSMIRVTQDDVTLIAFPF